MYGIMGNRGNFMYNYESTKLVCQYGREILEDAIEFFRRSNLLQCDTDGLFVTDKADRTNELIAHINLEHIEFECKGAYDAILISGDPLNMRPIKKRYVLYRNGTWECKGFELMRKNVIPLIREFQRECFDSLLIADNL